MVGENELDSICNVSDEELTKRFNKVIQIENEISRIKGVSIARYKKRAVFLRCDVCEANSAARFHASLFHKLADCIMRSRARKERGANLIICFRCFLRNVYKVRQQFLNGGHDVSPEKIISRYAKALPLLPELIHVCDICRIYDTRLKPRLEH